MCEEVSGSAGVVEAAFARTAFFSGSLIESLPQKRITQGLAPTAILSRLSLFFSAHTPERTHSEITKGQAEANGDHHPRKFAVSGLILVVLAIERNCAKSRQNKENKACNFQPELMQHAPEGTQRHLPRLEHCAHGPIGVRLP